MVNFYIWRIVGNENVYSITFDHQIFPDNQKTISGAIWEPDFTLEVRTPCLQPWICLRMYDLKSAPSFRIPGFFGDVTYNSHSISQGFSSFRTLHGWGLLQALASPSTPQQLSCQVNTTETFPSTVFSFSYTFLFWFFVFPKARPCLF